MITGAANAEAALLLIDAHEGVQEQSRRHGYLLNLLGIRQIVVLVNKMDLQDYSQARFDADRGANSAPFSKRWAWSRAASSPSPAKHGDNIASRSANMPWWSGPTVLEALDRFPAGRTAQPASRCASPSRTFTASTTAASWRAGSNPAR